MLASFCLVQIKPCLDLVTQDALGSAAFPQCSGLPVGWALSLGGSHKESLTAYKEALISLLDPLLDHEKALTHKRALNPDEGHQGCCLDHLAKFLDIVNLHI